MSLDACAALVARADPDRWAAVLAAPSGARAPLIVLYAYNIEISRAPWASAQPLIAQMRLQWWRDMLADPTPRAHEVAAPLRALLDQGRVDVQVLDAMAAARVWDIYAEPFDSDQDLHDYLAATAGGLVWASAQALGAPPQAQPCARAYGQAQGMAHFLRAAADLTARGRIPLRHLEDAALSALARQGLRHLSQARASARSLGPAWPALLACSQTAPLLHRAARHPHLIRQGNLTLAPATTKARLIWASLTHRV